MKTEISKAIARLENAFSMNLPRATKDEYVRILEELDEKTLMRAIDKTLYSFHPNGAVLFPPISVILDNASLVVREDLRKALSNNTQCEMCHGTGRYIRDYRLGWQEYSKEMFCTCPVGKLMRAHRAEYFRRRNHEATIGGYNGA